MRNDSDIMQADYHIQSRSRITAVGEIFNHKQVYINWHFISSESISKQYSLRRWLINLSMEANSSPAAVRTCIVKGG